MDDHGFFKFIWRFNAVVLAGMLVLLGGIMAWEMVLRDVLRSHTVVEVVNVDPQDTSIVETRSIVMNERVPGLDLYRLSLVSEQEYDSGYSSKGTRNSMLNTGFHDPESGTTKWLFPDGNQLVTDVETLSVVIVAQGALGAQGERDEEGRSSEHRKAFGHLISFVDTDTSGDKRLSNSDRKQVMATGPDGMGETIILSDLVGDLRVEPHEGTTFVVFYERADGFYSALYDAAVGTLKDEHKLARP